MLLLLSWYGLILLLHGEYEKAKEIDLQMLKIIEEQNEKQLSLGAKENPIGLK